MKVNLLANDENWDLIEKYLDEYRAEVPDDYNDEEFCKFLEKKGIQAELVKADYEMLF